MSKIICDVCGTSYPETAQQCPICGCARPGDAKPIAPETNETEMHGSGSYTYVKGGRFSKSNVKKRNRGVQVAHQSKKEPLHTESNKTGKVDAFLIATVVVLLIAIVAVVSYIAMRVFFPGILSGGNNKHVTDLMDPNSNTSSYETTNTTNMTMPCTGVSLSKTEIEFDKEGAVVLLNVTLEPRDTTDEVVFASTDSSVVTVTSDGKVEAVGPGEAVITVTCGQIVAECRVVCIFETATEPTEATEDTTETTTPASSSDTLRFTNKYQLPENPDIGDATLKKGTKWAAYVNAEGLVPSSEVRFTTSKAEVATISSDGIVTAVGVGEAYITAEYQGQKIKCRIIVVA